MLSNLSHPPLRSTQGPFLPRCAHRCAPTAPSAADAARVHEREHAESPDHSYNLTATPDHKRNGLAARDRHRPSQHHPYDLALSLSLSPLSVRPGPTRPDLDHGPPPARPGPARPAARPDSDPSQTRPQPHIRAAARIGGIILTTSRLRTPQYGHGMPLAQGWQLTLDRHARSFTLAQHTSLTRARLRHWVAARVSRSTPPHIAPSRSPLWPRVPVA
jgi:hypothetical protein